MTYLEKSVEQKDASKKDYGEFTAGKGTEVAET
ncbi:hypothetical protein COLO4_00358 [Corchorus olitorius]|uniref:Uncharacterized protein n=1 Tax=Corchorus olitorius TaxID=93759 RepID=A0A1R3L449_9ROSI|nr:hypothetical protein COLO4_00358 [Corchorus olitorius]